MPSDRGLVFEALLYAIDLYVFHAMDYIKGQALFLHRESPF